MEIAKSHTTTEPVSMSQYTTSTNLDATSAAALENIASTCTPPSTDGKGSARRAARYDLRRMLWTYSDLPRLHHCGRSRIGSHVGVRGSSKWAGFSGLQSCGSVWACPVCSAKVMARRSVEMGEGLLAWESRGGRLVMGTLTMRHHKGDRLKKQWDALGKAWSSVTRSRVWGKWLGRLGSPGLVRVVEVTYGETNGWHVHLHFVLLIGQEGTDQVDEFGAWLVQKWGRAIDQQGFPGALGVGQDVHLVKSDRAAEEMSQYLVKSTAYSTSEQMGREFFGSWTKGAKGTWSTVPAWRIAEGFKATGEVELLDLWHEYEKASKGRRHTTWSHGLRDMLGVGEEKTDEEIAEEDLGEEDQVLLDADAWSLVLKQEWPTSKLLDVMEKKGADGLKAFLYAHGIAWVEADRR